MSAITDAQAAVAANIAATTATSGAIESAIAFITTAATNRQALLDQLANNDISVAEFTASLQADTDAELASADALRTALAANP